MLSIKRLSLPLSCLLILVSFLSACSNSKTIEGMFQADPKLKEESGSLTSSPSPSPSPTAALELGNSFPNVIPIYTTAKLIAIEPNSTGDNGKVTWFSSDANTAIAQFYQQAFQLNNWQIIAPLSADNTLIASKDNLQVTLSIAPSSTNEGGTQFAIAYQAIDRTSSPLPTTTTNSKYTDLDRAPEQLRKYIQDLSSLGILTSTSSTNFNPEKNITRREYAKWLVMANNRFYNTSPGKQIRLASNTSQAAFQDIKTNDPDFGIIQGLAEAGLIPSPLSGDSTAVLFKPDAPLTRENLIAWKVPLDTRKSLPTASIDAVKETWGFQDTAKIEPKFLKALYVDYQNGEQANVLRVFGYTTLFQPKKTVTRAEAAATLWYFGFQGEGVSATDALKTSNS